MTQAKKEEIFFWHLEDIVKNNVQIPFPDSPNSINFISTSNAPLYDGLLIKVGNIIIQKNVTVLEEKNFLITSTTTIQFLDGISSLVSIQTFNSSSPFIADEIRGTYSFVSGRFFNKNPSYVFSILPDTTRRVIVSYD